MIGEKYLTFKVLSLNEVKSGKKYFDVICDCGVSRVARADHIKRGLKCKCNNNSSKPKESKKNSFVELVDCYEFTATNGSKFVVDKDDFDRVSVFNWYQDKKGYFYTRNNYKQIKLHRFILKLNPEDKMVDHIDRDKSNNKKSNLRLATNSQNLANVTHNKNNTSGFRGVLFIKDKNKWQAKYASNFLGYFNTFEEAKKARLEYENENLGEFAPKQIEAEGFEF